MADTIDVVLFDLDDTLLDAGTAWRAGVERVLLRCPELHLTVAMSAWDDAHSRHFPRYLTGELTYEQSKTARIRTWASLTGIPVPPGTELHWFADFLAGYSEHWTAFEDVAECLAALDGLRLGVITNGHGEQQRAKVAALGLTNTFEAVLAAGDVGIAKPDARIFLLAADKFGVSPARCAYVGDQHDIDALAAAAAGMTGIWLNRQARPAPGGLAPGAVVTQIASLAELPALLAGR
jgi:putative hydrolase of the HAD superfamily